MYLEMNCYLEINNIIFIEIIYRIKSGNPIVFRSNQQNYFQIQQRRLMPKTFITSTQQYDLQGCLKKVKVTFSDSKQFKLQEQIKIVLQSMPSYDICQQAAINIGMPNSLLNFQEILKQTAGRQNKSYLNQIYLKLKSLQKEAMRLTKSTIASQKKIGKQPSCYTIRRMMTKNSSPNHGQFVRKQKESESLQKLKTVLLEELAFRKKKSGFYSTQKLSKKQLHIKERIEKAKTLNKKALKVFKCHQEKQEQYYDAFKIETLYSPEMKVIKKQSTPLLLHQQKDFQTYQNGENQTFFIKVPSEEQKNVAGTCKTADSKRKKRQFITVSYDINASKDNRFEEYRARERAIKQKRKKLQEQKEELNLLMVINKRERIDQLNSPDAKKQRLQKQFVKDQSQLPLTHKEFPLKETKKPRQYIESSDEQIKAKCQQKQFKRQMQLQERVNNIREQFKMQQYRRERHRLNKLLQNEQKIHLNETLIKNFLNSCEGAKQQQSRHEMTIKLRHRELKEKENYYKLSHMISRLTEQQIVKQLAKIKQKEVQKEKQKTILG